MFQKIKISIAAIFVGIFVSSLALVTVPAVEVSAQNAHKQVCDSIGGCGNGGGKISGVIEAVINILSAIGGIIAIILVIIGGVKYMTSGGDSNAAANARNTILYAIVGLIIVVFAQVLVRFVLQQIQ
jgi:hypothetical protein